MDILGVLTQIEQKIPEALRNDLRKRIVTAPPLLIKLSPQLKNLVINNAEIKSVLFENNEDLIFFSGDILTRTFYDYYSIGESIEESFSQNLKNVKFTQNIN